MYHTPRYEALELSKIFVYNYNRHVVDGYEARANLCRFSL
jgi:hypothetical protein